jgi:hypothetical protein
VVVYKQGDEVKTFVMYREDRNAEEQRNIDQAKSF